MNKSSTAKTNSSDSLAIYNRQSSLIAEYIQNREIDKAISEFRKLLDNQYAYEIDFRRFFRFLIAEDRFEQIIPEIKRIMKRLDEYHRESLHRDIDILEPSFSARGFLAEVYMLLYTDGIKITFENEYSNAKKIFQVGIKSLHLWDDSAGIDFFKQTYNGFYLYNWGMEIFDSNPYKAFFILYKASKFLENKMVDLKSLSERVVLHEDIPMESNKDVLKRLDEIKEEFRKLGDKWAKENREDKRLELLGLVGEKAEYEIWDIKGRKPAFKKAVEDLRNRNKKGKLDIFVDEDGAVYFKGKKVKELKKTQILYDFLIYFLKNKGVGGTYENLFLEVWPIGKEKRFKPDFEITKSQKGNVIRMKNRLNTLFKNYDVKEMNYEYNKYRLAEDCNFYLIQKSIG